MEETKAIVSFINTTSKEDFQALGVTNRSKFIIVARKANGKHKHLKTVQKKTNSLMEKVNNFKSHFIELVKKSLSSFQDNQEYLISEENYQALFVHERNEDSKFDDIEKHLK